MNMRNVLITGVIGFVGHHLSREMKSRGWGVIGIGTQDTVSQELEQSVDSYFKMDLTNEAEVRTLDLSKINGVINLAGLANVGTSFDNPELYKKVNVEVLSVIGRLLLDVRSKARMVAVSTGAVYSTEQPLPLTEESVTATNSSPYAQSKLLMEKEATTLMNAGLDCVIARPFNHVGPGQLAGFLIPDLKERLIKAKNDKSPIVVGNLSTKRDYTDVRDVAKAYADLVTAESLEENLFNVCSGISRSGQEILELLIKEMGLEGKVTVEVNQTLIRPNDPLELYGSYSRINEETGWEPSIKFEQTIADFVKS